MKLLALALGLTMFRMPPSKRAEALDPLGTRIIMFVSKPRILLFISSAMSRQLVSVNLRDQMEPEISHWVVSFSNFKFYSRFDFPASREAIEKMSLPFRSLTSRPVKA